MSEPLITNSRGQREWDWIVGQIGQAAALAAICKLGNRKPFPLNVARVLGLNLPAELAEEPRHRRDCGDLLAILKGQ